MRAHSGRCPLASRARALASGFSLVGARFLDLSQGWLFLAIAMLGTDRLTF